MQIKMNRLFLVVIFLISSLLGSQGNFSGDLQWNAKIFDTDSKIGAAGTPFYNWSKFGSDSWLSLQYHHESQLELGFRFDMFNNTDLFSGGIFQENGLGLGSFYLQKKVKGLTITAGYIYDQFGSGAVFRSFENRGLGLDYPLVGMRVQYDISSHIFVKGLAGKLKDMRGFVANKEQKSFIEIFDPVIKGFNAEGRFEIDSGRISIYPGLAFINRTIDDGSMNVIASQINAQPVSSRFVPKYNVYTYSLYSHIKLGGVNLFAEYGSKTKDVLADTRPGVSIPGQLIDQAGQYIYGSAVYSSKGFGISLSARDTRFFEMRTSPLQTNLEGIINFLPPMTRQNSLRLPARYQANSQALDESAFQMDMIIKPAKGLVFSVNSSYVFNDNEDLFRELLIDTELKKPGKKYKMMGGIQMVDYNRKAYQQKGDWINTFTPFYEFTYKLTKRKSLRAEAQYLLTKRNSRLFGMQDDHPDNLQDLGDWVYGLIEFNIAPHYSFSVSDMYNIDREINYYDIYTSFTKGPNRFSLGYSKQVEGIICTGGVCRYEPAFSGVKMSLTSTF